ncbi:hypothetical protein L218DRAFT_962846 [Marasmius fiardii PR-910]|nr:hypothetical protein L218DRAFT_962846 [Marasmius fiardii PR-910]
MTLQDTNYESQSPSTHHEYSYDLSTIQYLQQHYPLPNLDVLDSNESELVYHPESVRRRTYIDAKAEKKRLEDCIKYVRERVIPRLEMELAQVTTVILEHELVHAPMHSLPTEILLCIMSFFLGPDNQNDLVNLSNSVWLLAQVCQRWRNIVLGTPSFWSNVAIDLCDQEHFLEPQHQSVPQVLSTFIRRSNALPLTISFKCNSGVTRLTASIMGILLQCRDRWRSILLDVTPALIPSTRSPIFQQANDSPTPLESLTLNMSFLTLLGSRVGLFQKTPHLKSLTLFGASTLRNREGLVETFSPKMPSSMGDGHTPLRAAGDLVVGAAPVAFQIHRGPKAFFFPLSRDISRKLLLPWKQLSKLDLEFAAFGDFLPVLNQASSLVDCCLRSYGYTRDAPGYSVITLPKLQSLKLFGTAVFCLHFLSAESLTSLIVEDTTQMIECGQLVIPPFIERSGCRSKLQHLTFQSTPGTYHGLDVIKTTPYLESLHLCVEATFELSLQLGTGALLDALTYPNGLGHESRQLRKLRTLFLSVYDEDTDKFPHEKLVEMVKSRRNVPVDADGENDGERCMRLEELRLEVNCYKNSWVNVCAQLKEIEGLRFEFSVRDTDAFYQSGRAFT